MAALVDGVYSPPKKRKAASSTSSSKGTSGFGSAPKSSYSAPAPSYSPPAPVPSRPVSSGSVKTVTPPSPKPPSLDKYLAGDTGYQQAIRGGNRTLQDFLSELNRRRGEAGTNFNTAQSALESDRTRQLERMKQEFASRGLIHSGLFAKEQGTFQEQFQQQQQQMQQAQQQLLADILSQGTSAKREKELALEVAKQQALARRAQRYNIPL